MYSLKGLKKGVSSNFYLDNQFGQNYIYIKPKEGKEVSKSQEWRKSNEGKQIHGFLNFKSM